ncbi:hypothetical protein NMG60_11016499 [Bertholletia excelsa]
MENDLGNQSHLRNLASQPPQLLENRDGLFGIPSERDADRILFDDSLEEVFSRLKLSPPATRRPALLPVGIYGDFGGVDPNPTVDYQADGDSSVNTSLEETVNLETVSHRDDANRRMSFSGAHNDLSVGAESPGAFSAVSYVTAECEQWHNGNGVLACVFDGSFLERKQQLAKQINSQFQISSSSNTNSFFIDSALHFDVSYSEHTSKLPPNLDSLSLVDLQGRMVSLAKDPHGCRLLQRLFDESKEKEIDMAVTEMISYTGDLMRDLYGNYVIQKLLKVCSEAQRYRILASATKSQFQLISLCLNPYGTRVVQRMVECSSTHLENSYILKALIPGTVVLCTDPNGHHVIQHCLMHFSDEENKLLLKDISKNFLEIATNKSGCCVIQSCIDYCQAECKTHFVGKTLLNALFLAQDPYGNYIVQHLLLLRIPRVTEALLRQLKGNFASLSCNKYASNVVEKCLIYSGEEQSSWITMELLNCPHVCMFLMDPFANFVIQSALSVSKQGPTRNALLHLIRSNASSMRSNLYGKKILAWCDKLLVHY